MEENRFYRLKRDKILKNLAKISEIWAGYPDFSMAYSLKVNCHPLVLETVRSFGPQIMAEAGSDLELKKARKFWGDSQIILNGVEKSRENFVCLCEKGGYGHIDNGQDLECCLEHFENSGQSLSIGVRLNFDIWNGIKSRFGIKTGSELYNRVVELNRQKKIRVRGLHCHFTKASATMYFERRAHGLCMAADDFEGIEYLDFGGNAGPLGDGSNMERIFDAVTGVVKNHFGPEQGKPLPKIILECGTPVVWNGLEVRSKVKAIKDGVVILDASAFDIGLNAWQDECRVRIEKSALDRSGEVEIRNGMLTGCTCLENDILVNSFNGKVCVGDTVVFPECGAYSYGWANDFMTARMDVV